MSPKFHQRIYYTGALFLLILIGLVGVIALWPMMILLWVFAIIAFFIILMFVVPLLLLKKCCQTYDQYREYYRVWLDPKITARDQPITIDHPDVVNKVYLHPVVYLLLRKE